MLLQQFIFDYGMFLLKVITALIAALILIAASKKNPQQHQNLVEFRRLNKAKDKERINNIKSLYEKDELKKKLKQLKAAKKPLASRLFVLKFNGDVKGSQVDNLRQEVSAIIEIAQPTDQVALLLTSPGGGVSAYGLASSQLARFKEHNISLTVAIDQVAASGGYMMACVADHIIAAPFAMIGSVGVVLQLPNFYHLLKKHNIEFEQLTAGQFKRTLSTFAKNTEQGRAKASKQVEEIHEVFKTHIKCFRPQLNIDAIATGEVWLGKQALDLKLIDEIQTSDDFVMKHLHSHQVVEVSSPDTSSKLAKLLKKTTQQTLDSLKPELWI